MAPKKAPPLTGCLREVHTSAIGSYAPSERGPKGFPVKLKADEGDYGA